MKNKDDNIYGTYKKIKHNESDQLATETTPIIIKENNTFSLRSVFNTLSLRRKKNNKKIITTAEVSPKIEVYSSSFPFQIINHDQPPFTDFADKQENPYEVIEENLSNLNGSKQKIIRDKILTPEEELLFPLIKTVNKHSGLREILNSIRHCPDLYDQIKLMQQFSIGSDSACTFSDYMEIVKKVDLSLNEIIKNLTGNNKDALKDLALQTSFYLFAKDLWNAFMPIEGNYETIEGDYENTKEVGQTEPGYMDMNGVRKLGFFAVNTDKKEEAQQEELYIAPNTALN